MAENVEAILRVIRENTKTMSNNINILKKIEEDFKENTKTLKEIREQLGTMAIRYDKLGGDVRSVKEVLLDVRDSVKPVGPRLDKLDGDVRSSLEILADIVDILRDVRRDVNTLSGVRDVLLRVETLMFIITGVLVATAVKYLWP